MASIDTIGGDDFLSHVSRVRSEIRDKFSRAHKVLQDRETDLLAKVQEWEDEYTGDEINKRINKLNVIKDRLIVSLPKNADKEVLEKSIAPIDANILELERKLQNAKDTYRSVTLEWDAGLEDTLSLTGEIHLIVMTQEQVRDYKKIELPVLTFGTHRDSLSSSPGVFCYPRSLTMDPATNNLYICDGGNARVQVFNKSFQYIFMFSDKMDQPAGICLNRNTLYITQLGSNLLSVYSTSGEYIQSVGRKGKDNLEFDKPRGIDISTEMNRIFIAEFGNDRIHCLKLDLTFHSIIGEIPGAKDVKLTPEEIVVLSSDYPCVSLYSYSNQLIKKMIPFGPGCQLKSSISFVLDRSFNLFITDVESHCICVYSYRGEFLHKFGKEGDQKGEFINPRGITITPHGRIIVTSNNPSHPIQIF